MNEVDKIYEKYSKINPYNSKGLRENFKKIENKTVYYYLPSWISKLKEDKWVASFRLSKYLKDDVNKQIYYDLVCLGISSIEDRPKCRFCNNEAKFLLSKGYYTYCYLHKVKHVGELVSKKLKGRPLSEENKRNISLSKKGKKLTEEQRLKRPRGYHFHLSQEAKEKISRSKKGKVKSRSYYKSGIYKSTKCKEDIYYLSSYERDFLMICDYSKFIVNVEVPEPIQYYYSGGNHNYYPDFLITTDSGIKLMVEVKAFNLLNNSLVIAKRIAGLKWCKENNAKYITLTEKDIYKHINHRKQINKNLYIYKYIV